MCIRDSPEILVVREEGMIPEHNKRMIEEGKPMLVVHYGDIILEFDRETWSRDIVRAIHDMVIGAEITLQRSPMNPAYETPQEIAAREAEEARKRQADSSNASGGEPHARRVTLTTAAQGSSGGEPPAYDKNLSLIHI